MESIFESEGISNISSAEVYNFLTFWITIDLDQNKKKNKKQNRKTSLNYQKRNVEVNEMCVCGGDLIC